MKNSGTHVTLQKAYYNWPSICANTAKTFRLTFDEQECFFRNKVARLVGTLPYIAGCEEAERTALAHIAVYITALRGGRASFAHTQADNTEILERLRLGASFKGGNKTIINRGMNLLALVMLCGYERNKEKDIVSGEYNPLNEGIWDFETMKTMLLEMIDRSPCEELDTVFSIKNGLLSSWS